MATDETKRPEDLEAFYEHISGTGLVRRLLEIARDEDLGEDRLDITALATESAEHDASADLILREDAVVSGLRCIPDLIEIFGGELSADLHAHDGDHVSEGARLATLRGPLDAIVTIERTLLNLVGRLSGVATLTRKYVDAAGPDVHVLDTRKTTPGMRVLEKYAVRCGGGHSHRMGLFDAALIKDNHIAHIPAHDLEDWLTNAAMRAKSRDAQFVEVEVDTIEQLREVLKIDEGRIDYVLLDNMSPAVLQEAVKLRDQAESSVKLEASGGVRLDTIAEIAQAGVDRISSGALTHQATSIDIGLDMDLGV